MDGFGAVDIRQSEPFHAEWERRVWALQTVLREKGVLDRIPQIRYATERIPPVQYLAMSYAERGLTALTTQLVERGLLTREAIEAATGTLTPLSTPMPDDLPAPEVPTSDEPRFDVNDRVRVRNQHPRGHTRCPRYVRGRLGTIAARRGSSVFDDVAAVSEHDVFQPLYTVGFSSVELWGVEASATSAVYVDLFDAYLEPA
jgi:nitrile hydratase